MCVCVCVCVCVPVTTAWRVPWVAGEGVGLQPPDMEVSCEYIE